MDREEFLRQWRALMREARQGLGPTKPEAIDIDAINLLISTVTSGAYLLDQLAESPSASTIIKEIAARHTVWPVLFGGVLPSDQQMYDDLGLGKELPYRHDPGSRVKRDRLEEVVLDLLFRVIQAGGLYQLYQTPDYRLEDELPLPDYAPLAAKLGQRVERDFFEPWWKCVEAEFDRYSFQDWWYRNGADLAIDVATELNKLFDEDRTAEMAQLINSMSKDLLKQEAPRAAFRSHLKEILRRKLYSLAYK